VAEPPPAGEPYPAGHLPGGGGIGRNALKDPPLMAIVHFPAAGFEDPQTIQNYAQADLLVLETSNVWSEAHPHVLNQIRALNPDIMIVGYISAHATFLEWANADPSVHPYLTAWYEATQPYWSYSTTGDTMLSWPGKVLLDVLDPGCRTAMVEVIADQQAQSANKLDGVFWDHFGVQLWVMQNIPGVDGDPDLDSDGIGHDDDPDEIEAYRLASEELVRELRARMGDRFLQVVNGSRALMDSSFAALTDGMMYENFPDVGFSGPHKMANSLDLGRYNNLFAARHWPRTLNGGPFLILSNKSHFSFTDTDGVRINYNPAEFNRVVALLTDTGVSYHSDDPVHSYGWPEVELDLGPPTSGVIWDGSAMTRTFANGWVTLTFNTYGWPIPFDFEIVQDGEVVQSMDYPAHFP
jgi:hypothetical protein